MAVNGPMELISSLSRGAFDDVLGTAESGWVDFKDQPYKLDRDQQKWELAKDVAAFARSDGGYIVIGVRTERHEQEVADVAVKIRLVEKGLIDASRYRDVIDSWIYPLVRALGFQWFFPSADETRGIFAIEVPPQRDRDQPFIVRRMFNEGGTETGGFGIPEREGDRIIWLPAEEIHRQIQSASMSAQPAVRPGDERLLQRRDERVAAIERIQGWDEEAFYYLQAVPLGSDHGVSDLYEREGLLQALASPDVLRYSGFNIRVARDPEPVQAGLLARESRKLLWVDQDGMISAAAQADRDFLGWAINDKTPEDGPLRINRFALVEFTLEFFRFVSRELDPRIEPQLWRYRVGAKRFRSHQVLLAPGESAHPGSWDWHEATSDDWMQDFDGNASEPGREAFEGLKRTYSLFGLGADAIPFVRNSELSEDAILAI